MSHLREGNIDRVGIYVSSPNQQLDIEVTEEAAGRYEQM
jgi:hypothetical protein